MYNMQLLNGREIVNHLEKLIRQYYEFKGYLVKGNIKVGKLSHGGWEGELDIVAYDPKTEHLIHLEPSIDAHSWAKREERFAKKFSAGRKYIIKDVFPWLKENHKIDQVAIFPSGSRGEIAGGRIKSIDGIVSEIKALIIERGKGAKNAVPEEFDLLRTIQFTECGYHKVI